MSCRRNLYLILAVGWNATVCAANDTSEPILNPRSVSFGNFYLKVSRYNEGGSLELRTTDGKDFRIGLHELGLANLAFLNTDKSALDENRLILLGVGDEAHARSQRFVYIDIDIRSPKGVFVGKVNLDFRFFSNWMHSWQHAAAAFPDRWKPDEVKKLQDELFATAIDIMKVYPPGHPDATLFGPEPKRKYDFREVPLSTVTGQNCASSLAPFKESR